MNFRNIAAHAVLAVTGIASAPALSQEEASSQVIEEIVVTASKRGEQQIQDIPLPITAFSGEDIERGGAATVGDFINRTPGLTQTPVNPGNNVIQIRGISSLFGDPTVGLYLDDVPFATVVNLEFPEIPSFDLNSVEVLRGPQGTLYGASSQGGTVVVRTMDASTTEFEAKVNASGATIKGGEGSYSFNGAVNLPVVEDRFGVRLTAGVHEIGGWVDDSSIQAEDVNDATLTNFRVKATLTPTDRLEMRFGAWFQDLDADGFNVTDDSLDRPLGARLVAGAPLTGVDEEFADYDYEVYNLAVEYDFDAVSLYSATSWMAFEEQIYDGQLLNLDPATFAFSAAYDNRTVENLSQEVRLVSNADGRLAFTLGALFNDNETTFLFSPGPKVPGIVDEVVESQSWAVFGELTWSFTDTVDATVGLRYYEDEREDTELPESLSTAFLQLTGIPTTREAKFTSVQPKFNLSWQPNDDHLVFLNAARGFRSGIVMPGGVVALNALFGFFVDLDVNEESLWNYEVGAKGVLADGRLNYELAAYYIDWQNIQIFGAEPGVGIAFAFSGPDAEVYGLDWAMRYATDVEGLTLSATGNVNQSEYASESAFTDVNGRVAVSGVAGGDVIFNVPKFSTALALDYEFDWASLGGRGLVMLELQHNSSRKDVANGTFGNANTFVNVRFGLERDSYGLYVYGRNLSDESGAMFPTNAEAASLGSGLASRPQPRTFGVGVNWRFQ